MTQWFPPQPCFEYSYNGTQQKDETKLLCKLPFRPQTLQLAENGMGWAEKQLELMAPLLPAGPLLFTQVVNDAVKLEP